MGGLFGALIGYFAGQFLSSFRLISLGEPKINAEQRDRQTQAFAKTVFMLMGALAKADNRVSEQEIAQAELYMTNLQLTGERRNLAIGYFKTGSSKDFDIDATLSAFIDICGRSAKLKHLVVVYLIGIAIADGTIDPAEDTLLRKIALQLGYAPRAYDLLLSMVLGQSHFSQKQAGGYQHHNQHSYQRTHTQPNAQSELKAAYQALGVKKTDSDKSIKKAYRKLISEFHPDKLIGQGVPEEMVKVATQRSQEIQTAYQIIEDSRKA